MLIVEAKCRDCGRALIAAADDPAPRCPPGTCPVRFFLPSHLVAGEPTAANYAAAKAASDQLYKPKGGDS